MISSLSPDGISNTPISSIEHILVPVEPLWTEIRDQDYVQSETVFDFNKKKFKAVYSGDYKGAPIEFPNRKPAVHHALTVLRAMFKSELTGRNHQQRGCWIRFITALIESEPMDVANAICFMLCILLKSNIFPGTRTKSSKGFPCAWLIEFLECILKMTESVRWENESKTSTLMQDFKIYARNVWAFFKRIFFVSFDEQSPQDTGVKLRKILEELKRFVQLLPLYDLEDRDKHQESLLDKVLNKDNNAIAKKVVDYANARRHEYLIQSTAAIDKVFFFQQLKSHTNGTQSSDGDTSLCSREYSCPQRPSLRLLRDPNDDFTKHKKAAQKIFGEATTWTTNMFVFLMQKLHGTNDKEKTEMDDTIKEMWTTFTNNVNEMFDASEYNEKTMLAHVDDFVTKLCELYAEKPTRFDVAFISLCFRCLLPFCNTISTGFDCLVEQTVYNEATIYYVHELVTENVFEAQAVMRSSLIFSTMGNYDNGYMAGVKFFETSIKARTFLADFKESLKTEDRQLTTLELLEAIRPCLEDNPNPLRKLNESEFVKSIKKKMKNTAIQLATTLSQKLNQTIVSGKNKSSIEELKEEQKHRRNAKSASKPKKKRRVGGLG